jgi:DNA-binding NarL/FixJ family response regulator
VAVTRVLLCDDAVAFGVLFERWMAADAIDVVGQATTAEESVAMAREQQPEVIVVDHLLRDATSDQLVPRLRAAAPDARLLLISGMSDDRLAGIAAAAGVDAYIAKAATGQAMSEAVHALSR